LVNRLQKEEMNLRPGHVLLFQKKFYLGCIDGPLEVLEIKPEGKRAMPGTAFAAGLQGAKTGNLSWEALDV
ncbi:MAG: hypothetical protein Q4E66_12370, partial [Comamonadaceae bacterium]|nr:hypothetical protein [Comamonadaceae bacterium]